MITPDSQSVVDVFIEGVHKKGREEGSGVGEDDGGFGSVGIAALPWAHLGE